MTDNKSSAFCDNDELYDPTEHFVITVNEGEIPISTGEFYRMRRDGLFISDTVDENDFVKIIGVTADGTVYVSEKCDFDMTDEEFDEYYERRGIGRHAADLMIKYHVLTPCDCPCDIHDDGTYYMSVLSAYASIVDIGPRHESIPHIM